MVIEDIDSLYIDCDIWRTFSLIMYTYLGVILWLCWSNRDMKMPGQTVTMDRDKEIKT